MVGSCFDINSPFFSVLGLIIFSHEMNSHNDRGYSKCYPLIAGNIIHICERSVKRIFPKCTHILKYILAASTVPFFYTGEIGLSSYAENMLLVQSSFICSHETLPRTSQTKTGVFLCKNTEARIFLFPPLCQQSPESLTIAVRLTSTKVFL